MATLGIQGIRGGVGTTSITAALAWSLQALGESVLVIDACPENLLRLSFNIDFAQSNGWARALLDGHDWRDAGMRYTSLLDILPFGQLTASEAENLPAQPAMLNQLTAIVRTLQSQSHYQWVLIDLPHGFSSLTRPFIELCDHTLTVIKPDTNCHVRLHQQPLPTDTWLLVNDLRLGSQIQDDLWQVWLQSQRHMLPVSIHRDEAVAECMAAKQPLGEYRSDALAAEEVMTLANWCILNFGKAHEEDSRQERSTP
ncbi:cellulose biosynthesis protein BcsQ [Vagococcus sp. WN89Y]|uniref:cellulose biosynthesis protein BcsQ n=1 Tax=Vagococcus sp. WN89Y TaxID=3457258 RepID=UPI003FCCD726